MGAGRLSRAVGAWLIHLADPARLTPAPREKLLAAEIPDLLAAAAAHGVLPAVLRGLPGTGAALEAGRLQLAYATGFNMLLSHHADRAMAALRAAGVHATIVKGRVFARRIYPDAALRGFTDIDILLRPADREAGGRALAALGFAAQELAYRTGRDYAEDKWVLAGQPEAAPEVLVELHADLVHNPKLRRALRLDYQAVLEAGDGDAEDATALLLIAAVHGAASHQFDRLQHLVDVLLLARGAAGPIDMQRLKRVAARCGAGFAVAAALAITGQVFAEPRRAVPLAGIARRLISADVILRAQGQGRSADSWRRKAFRQLLRLG